MQNPIRWGVRGISRWSVLLMVIIAFSIINTAVWLWIDTRPPRWDEAGYLNISLKYHEALTTGGVGSFIRALTRVDRKRPTFVSALAVPGYLLFGRSIEAALAVHVSAFVVLLLAVYGLGDRLVSPAAGVLAAFFVSTYPSVFGLSRVFLFDFWDTALVAASLYLLMRTEWFSHKRASLGLGVYSSDVEQSDQEKASSHSKHGEQRESRGQGQSERSDAPQVSG
ncbi:MAG: ArnT family glycosyltransferase, partial [Candidatus Binatia bacterium]